MLSLRDVFEHIRGQLPADLEDGLELLEVDRMGYYVPLLLLDSRVIFTCVTNSVKIRLVEGEFRVKKTVADCFFLAVLSGKRDEWKFLYDHYIDNIGEVVYDFRDYFKEKVDYPDDGQGKICVSILPTLQNCEPVLRVLVIGSGAPAEAKSGLSYDSVFENLSLLGYSGEAHLFDPFEITQECKIGNFLVKHFGKCFSYDKYLIGGKDPTHIWDDAWVTAHPHSGPILFPGIEWSGEGLYQGSPLVKVEEIDRGSYLDIWRTKNNYYVLVSGYDLKTVQTFIKTKVPFNVGVYVKEIFNMRETLLNDKDELFENYPEAKIVVKYVGESCQLFGDYYVAQQTMYQGFERRIYYNCDPIEDSNYGDDCPTCRRIGGIMLNVKSYSNYPKSELIQKMLTSIVGISHVPLPGKKMMYVRQAIIAAAKRGLEVVPFKISFLEDNPSIKEDCYVRTQKMLINSKVVGLDYRNRHLMDKEFIHEATPFGEAVLDMPIYWNKFMTEFAQMTVPISMFDKHGIRVRPRALYYSYYPNSFVKIPKMEFTADNDVEVVFQAMVEQFGPIGYYDYNPAAVQEQIIRVQRKLPMVNGIGHTVGVGHIRPIYMFHIDVSRGAGFYQNFRKDKGYELAFRYGVAQLWVKGWVKQHSKTQQWNTIEYEGDIHIG